MEKEWEKLSRPRVEALDEILGVPFKVLDDGFVRVIDYMGSDESIVQAARISYGTGTRKVREDQGLIRYLLRHRHTTPFEMCEIKLHVRPDGYVATVDSAQDGECERVLDTVLGGNRRGATDDPRRMAEAVPDEPARE